MSSNLSRRSFVRLAAGALAYLPRVASIPGAFLLATAPTAAWAEDGLRDGYDPAHVVVIDPDELGIQAIDVVSGLALEGAYVTVTSYANGAKTQVIDGYTDASGVWVSNVADLCEPDGLEYNIKRYEFYARIEVQKDGYRPFTTALVRVVAGEGLAVGTQPIEAGKPYPRMGSFNEFDILYSATEFIRSSTNDTVCALELLVENMNATSNVTAELCKDEVPLGIKGSFAVDQGNLRTRFEGTYLLTGGSDSLAAGAGYSVHLTYSTNDSSNVEMTVPLNMVVMDAPVEVQAPGTSDTTESGERRTFCIFNRALVEDPGITFPDSWPIIGGQKLRVWTPECWCGFAFDPFGFIRISFKTPPFGMKDKYGSPEDQKTGWHPRQDAETQTNKYKENIAKQKGKEQAFIGGWDPFWDGELNPEALTADQPVKKLGITAMGEVAAIMQWKMEGDFPKYYATDLEGIAIAHIMAGLDYLYKQQFVAACIPMVFTFGVNFSIDVGVTADITSKSFADLLDNNFEMDLAQSGFSITIGLIVTMSIGAGVDGLCTVSLRGMLTITFFIGFGRESESLPLPHFVFSLGFVAQVVLQFLLFTQIWVPLPDLQEKISGKEPLWDSWDNKQLRGWPEAKEERPSLYEFMTKNTCILTSDTLEAHSEYEVDYALDADAAYLDRYLVGMLESTVQTLKTNDGTPCATSVYAPVSPQRFETLKGKVLEAMNAGGGNRTLQEILAQESSEGDDIVPVFGTSGSDLDSRAKLSRNFMGRYNTDVPIADVDGLGMFEGVRPSADNPITQGVFSDPRFKLVSIFGRACMVRIATVELSTGDARTRLVLQELPADGASEVPMLLDFELSVGRYPRYEYYDYEFDVIQATTTDEKGNERCDLHLMVVSGVREDDDDTTLVGAAQGHIFSYVRYAFTDANDLSKRYAVAAQVVPDKIHATDCPEDWDNHLYLSPQIKMVEQDGQKACVMAFVDRAGQEDTGTLNDQSLDETRVGVGMFFAKVEDGKSKEEMPVLSLPDLSDLREKLGDMGDLALTSMDMVGMMSDYLTIKFGGNVNHYLLLSVNPAFDVTIPTEGEPQSESAAGISQIVRVSDEAIKAVLTDPEETQLDLQEVPGEQFMLTCVNGMLQRVTWGNVESGDPVPQLEACGPEGVQIRSFTVDPSGEFIYWPTVADGDAPTKYDDYGKRLPDEKVKLYHIMACRMRNGAFSKPFQLAEEDGHPIDTLRVMENTDESISFTSVEVQAETDVTDSGDAVVTDAQANVWFTVVPHLRCLTVAYLAAEMAIVHVGDDVSFRIALRNDGNTYLKQATIRLATGPEDDAEVLATHDLVFSEENILVSQWNPQDADGKPTGVESDFALAPGATSLYHIPGFTVPENAPHDYYVYASVVKDSLVMADMDGIFGQAEQGVKEFLGTGYKTIASGERVMAGKTLTTVVDAQEREVDVSRLRPSNVTIDTGGGSGRSGGGSSSGVGGRKGNLPQTGDDTPGLGAAGLAMGAAGAAMVAYSRRREQIEREHEAEVGE